MRRVMFVTTKKKVDTADGVSLYYETYYVDALGQQPTRPTFFLVHGMGGDLEGWTFVRDLLLAQGFSCVALDLRGNGLSGHPRGWQSYARELAAQPIKRTS